MSADGHHASMKTGREEGLKASIEMQRRALGRQKMVFEAARLVPSPTSGCGGEVPVSGGEVPVSGGEVPVSGGAVRGVWETKSPFQGRVRVRALLGYFRNRLGIR